jgi:hypothetical protein
VKVKITKVTSWKDVLNAARFTKRKEPLDKEPSDNFKRDIIRAEHSPLRCLMFNIDFYDIPYYVSVHLVRHVHSQPFVSTSRPDSNKKAAPRDEQKKADPVNMRLFLNAQEIINISKVRLCTHAEKETRNIWQQVVNELYKQESLLATACVPSCIYRNMCPELNCCGYAGTDAYLLAREEYCNILM